MDVDDDHSNSNIIPELYFLISKFLSSGPLEKTAKVLVKELEEKHVLPKRTDWLGNEHYQTYDELERKYSHIGANHLLEICARIGPILDKELPPSVQGFLSLLGAGRQNLLRTKESVSRPRSLLDYSTRLHGTTLPDSAINYPIHNLQKVLIGQESGGLIRRKFFIPTSFYSKTRLLRRTLGHLSAVYCVLFDRSGRYIITGADDLLVKLWSAVDGRLLATFRGASAEITDIAINLDNTLLAAGSLDRILRVWDLQTTAPIAVLQAHTGMITSVNFCPSPRNDLKYLVTTSTDGSVAFWQYQTPRGSKTLFAPKPTQYHEKLRPGQAQMICASFSPGGIFLAAGSADHHVRVYLMHEDGPKRILETEAHTDAVDSIQWAHQGLRFISGSKDGIAHLWSFESQQWKSIKLNMNDRLPSCPEPEEGKKVKVTMVAWDYSDKWVMTAVNDFTIKIWCAKTGKLSKVLRGHTDEIYGLESHPIDESVLLSAGHDGQLFIWDIESGQFVASFLNDIDGQGHGGIFDAKWSPDGTMMAATDSHGHILMFGFGEGHERFKILPKELFFHTDYRPLLRDAAHMVLDEQTQMVPHLMPPPFLVDVDGNPHPPIFQRLVPGRETCTTEQLIPNISVGPEGVEVIDINQSFSHLDRLIEALANRQGQDQQPDSNNDRGGNNFGNVLQPRQSPRIAAAVGAPVSPANRVGLRRTGDVEGVRQSSGNWNHDAYKWVRRIFVKPIRYARLQTIRQQVYSSGLIEQEIYRREMRRRPIMISTGNQHTVLQQTGRGRGVGRRRGQRNAYRTRAVREAETPPPPPPPPDEDNEEDSDDSDSNYSTDVNEEMLNQSSSSTSDTESSDYSDWVADRTQPNLEPPKRAKRKHVERRHFSPSTDTDRNEPCTSTGRRGRKPKIQYPKDGQDIPENFKPPEWLSEVIPRKAPYYPQMGDEVVYFRQGHARYVDAVNQKKIYKVNENQMPWNQIDLHDHEIARVIGIKYELKPPRLCCLKLAVITEIGQMTGDTFTIKYHDMPDVLDFLVLKQTFDAAVSRNWSPGDRFRCMIDDGWWIGQIESYRALDPEEFPSSLFMCFRVRWDNGEYEYMSPWDMEPIDDNRLPDDVGGAVQVLPEELRAILYQPKAEEWPRGDREASCRRIVNGLELVMGLAIADPFLAPVDLNSYPSYAYIVEYPIDLTTIKARFENHFYRRITSAQFDVRYLATNAEKFNQSHSVIVKHARIITELCLKIVREYNDVDVGAVYHQLMATYISSESENDNDNEAGPSTSTAASPSKRPLNGSRRSKRLKSDTDWRHDCRELLEMLWQCDDSTPFREPVDTLEHPDYLQIVDTPMDLGSVREDLRGGNYQNPLEFAKDVRVIFTNSKNYNTNKRSRIYSMTLRLSALFETHMKKVFYHWKKRRTNKTNRKTPDSRNRPGASNADGDDNSSDDDDDDVPKRPRRAVGRTNGVTSTQNSAEASNRRNPKRINSRPNSQEESNSTSDSSSNSTSDDDDTDRSEAPGRDLSKFRSSKKRVYDSEDSFNPRDVYTKKKKTRKNARKRKSKSEDKYRGNNGTNRRGRKKRREDSSDDNQHNDNDDDDEYGEPSRKATNRRGRQRSQKTQSTDGTNSQYDNVHNSDDDNDGPLNTPKKRRGRPPRNAPPQPQSPSDDLDTSGCSEEVNASPPPIDVRPSTSRGIRSNRMPRMDADQSYHLTSQSRRPIVESDTEERENPRPTRSSIKKALMEWARGSECEDEEINVIANNGIGNNGRPRRVSRRKKTSESEQSIEDSNRRTPCSSSSSHRTSEITSIVPDVAIPRTIRTNRNSRVIPEDDEESDDSDNEPLVNASRSRTTRSLNNFESQRTTQTRSSATIQSQEYRRQNNPSIMNRRSAAAIPSTSTHITRSSSHLLNNRNTESQQPTSTQRINQANLHNHIHNDHDYGEPSTSSSRHTTRRMLSRHQRNADELDSLASDDISDPLDSTFITASRLRNHIRNTNVNSTTPTTASSSIRALRQRRNTSNNNTNQPEPTQQSDNSDSEDNQPLNSIVERNTATNSRQHYTEDDDDDDDEDDDPLSKLQKRSPRHRNQKRPHYNENSDESAEVDNPKKRQRNTVIKHTTNSNLNETNHQPYPVALTSHALTQRVHRTTANYYSNNSLRNQGTGDQPETNDNHNENNDSDQSEENEQTVSISSRGRIRKINPKMKGYF